MCGSSFLEDAQKRTPKNVVATHRYARIICLSALVCRYISIVYERLAGGYGIGYSESLTCRFGQVDSCKRRIEVKIQLSEVG